MRFERLTISGGLAARLELPLDDEPASCAIFAHCLGCAPDLPAASAIGRALAQERIAVLRFDAPSSADTGNAVPEVGVGADDIVAAAELLTSRGLAPAILVGHSRAGPPVLHAAARVPSVRAVVTINSPAGGTADVVRAIGRPLLVFHSPADHVVPIGEATKIYVAAQHPKSFVSLDDADHLLSNERDALYAGSVIAAWVARYVDTRPHAGPAEEESGTRIVARTKVGGFRTEILAGGHALVADEPKSHGGTESGPTPYDLLVAALGACTAMTLQLYAGKKRWPLEEAVVRLQHRKVHALDDEQCAARPARLDHLDSELELVGALDAAQRQRLMEIAERCPVHQTLDAGVRVTTSLRESSTPAAEP